MPVVEIPERQILTAAQAPVIGVLQNPRFCAALGPIKVIRLVEDLEKDVLHHIFRFTWIAKDSQSNFQDEPMKAVEQNRQGVWMPVAELLHEVFVGHVRAPDNRHTQGRTRRLWGNGLVIQAQPFRRNRFADFGRTPSFEYAYGLAGLYQKEKNLAGF